jgi:hypothetical protein
MPSTLAPVVFRAVLDGLEGVEFADDGSLSFSLRNINCARNCEKLQAEEEVLRVVFGLPKPSALASQKYCFVVIRHMLKRLGYTFKRSLTYYRDEELQKLRKVGVYHCTPAPNAPDAGAFRV